MRSFRWSPQQTTKLSHNIPNYPKLSHNIRDGRTRQISFGDLRFFFCQVVVARNKIPPPTSEREQCVSNWCWGDFPDNVGFSSDNVGYCSVVDLVGEANQRCASLTDSMTKVCPSGALWPDGHARSPVPGHCAPRHASSARAVGTRESTVPHLPGACARHRPVPHNITCVHAPLVVTKADFTNTRVPRTGRVLEGGPGRFVACWLGASLAGMPPCHPTLGRWGGGCGT